MLINFINLSENERGTDLKTYAYYRNEIQKISIDKFKEASGFECSVEMMEDSIKSFKSDIFDYKLLANAHKRYRKVIKNKNSNMFHFLLDLRRFLNTRKIF